MIYNNLIKNQKIIDSLNKYLDKNLPHSFIFYGGVGTGKFGHAIEFSNLILRKNNDSIHTSEKIKKNLHENINYILPLPRNRTIGKNDPALKALSQSDIEEIQNKIQLKLRNPYCDMTIDKANTILINSIRDIKKKINLSNYNNQYNIYLILDAEKLCYPRTESANSLLKILEEPHDNNLFILITSNISKMLDTLKSRCTKIFFPNLKNEEINFFLQNELNINNDDSNFIAHLCNGDATFAIELSNNFEKRKDNIKKIIYLIINYDINEWEKNSTNLKNKKEFKISLRLLLIFFTDVINYKNNSTSKQIRCKFCVDEIKKISAQYKSNNIHNCIDIINETEANMVKNLHMPLLITTFYLEIFQSLNKNNQ